MSGRRKGGSRSALVAVAVAMAAVALWGCRPDATVHPGPDGAVVTGCAWLAWILGGCTVLSVAAARTATCARSRVVRRAGHAVTPAPVRQVVARAVGVGVVVSVLTSGHSALATAGRHHHATDHGATVLSLDWPRSSRPRAAVLVRPGDCLWTITTRALGPGATTARVAATWPGWWRSNRAVIGPDPDVVLPGQRLRPPVPRPRSNP